MADIKHCYNCKYYNAYYTKGYKQFDKTDLGLCTKTKTTVEKSGECDNFSRCSYTRFGRKEAALVAVRENINLLFELKQILEDDNDDLIDDFANNLKDKLRK